MTDALAQIDGGTIAQALQLLPQAQHGVPSAWVRVTLPDGTPARIWCECRESRRGKSRMYFWTAERAEWLEW